MEFAHDGKENGSKIGKIAIVLGFHIALGAAIVMNSTVFITKPGTPPPPGKLLPPQEFVDPLPEPVEIERQMIKPETKVYVPETEINIQAKAEPNQIVVDYKPAENNDPIVPFKKAVEGEKVGPVTKTAPGIRQAVFAKSCGMPEYPAKAARNGDSGTVSLALLIDAEGKVRNSRIASSSGSRELDRAAQEALVLCDFKPATNNGVAEQGWAKLSYVWTLDQ